MEKDNNTPACLANLNQGFADGEATIRDNFGQALSNGKAFASDTGVIDIGTAQFFAATWENPSDSGVNYVTRAIVVNASTSANPELLLNPDSNTPSTTRNSNTLVFGSAATTDSVVKADSQDNEMTSGTGEDTGIVFNIPGSYEVLPFEAVLQPGNTLGISGGGNLAGGDVSLTILYHESAV